MIVRRPAFGLALALTLIGLGAGCDAEKPRASTADTASSTTTQAALTGNLTVLAAASLTEAFNELGKAFEGLPPYCLALMQNVPDEEQTRLTRSLDVLDKDDTIGESIKVRQDPMSGCTSAFTRTGATAR